MKLRRWLLSALALTIVFALFVQFYRFIPGGERIVQKVRGRYSIEERMQQYAPESRARLKPYFQQAGVAYPPARIVLVGLKEERELRLYAANDSGRLKLIHVYPVIGASGDLGPKLREGDMQVPEGVYRIEALNPNSAFHLSLRVNYPSDFDRAQAERDGRTTLGSDIMIHGGDASVGCLAIGDEAAAELFCLAAEKWPQEIKVLLCPRDLREHSAPKIEKLPWTKQLYQELKAELKKLPE